ncbi:hypothetical protein AZ026_001135 [Klebsiella pneumoniae]|uniref:hypothetical protein n=1 Tax=Klebsiella pneumoniae TaxID=573 RepID=UPI000B63B454|nr:hypothetical protein [Klebsiella pneumoniae]OUH59632.1 hypothetical protein AZ026_001135 [Klebsiella pneumoniae]
MPVNIFDIPSEEKTSQKTLSLWVEFGICVCILAVYVCVFLVYFPEYLSKNNYAFWSELLLVPLLLSGAVFFFRVIIWNNEDIETVYWNKTRLDYYQELLQKGRAYLEVIELQVRLPDLNGGVTNIIEGDLLPVRYAPKLTHMSRYLSFNSPINELNSIHQIQDRNAILFNKIMGFLTVSYTHLDVYKRLILYDILLYDKIYDAIIVLDSIPYSTPEDLKYIKESLVSINGYYRYDALDVAFRIIAKDQIVIVDPDTGKALPKVPKTDDNGKIILINGKPVMVDDPDGYNPVILKRLPEVTVFD